MKKSKKTLRRKLLEKRFTELASEKKADIVVPDTLEEAVFQTLESIQEPDAPKELIPPIQDKIIALFNEEREEDL